MLHKEGSPPGGLFFCPKHRPWTVPRRSLGVWVDESKTMVGHEISFNRYFYEYTSPRPLADMLAEVTE